MYMYSNVKLIVITIIRKMQFVNFFLKVATDLINTTESERDFYVFTMRLAKE